jgi:tetratricopeptide (TPR) repeat protein
MAAYDKGEFDFWSLFGIGYTYLIDDNYDEAIRFFEKSLKLNQDYSLTHYNLAYAHLKLKQPQKALLYAENAFIIQVIPSFKSETAVLLSTIHLELKNEEKALFFLREANKLTPKNYNVLLPLVELEVAMDVGDAIWDTNELFNLAPRNPIIYQDLLKIFSENEKEKDYAKFLESKKNDFKNDVLISANIFFYLAICQYEMNEWVSAKINFETARSKFRNIYSADHNVFKVINSYTEAIKKKKKV